LVVVLFCRVFFAVVDVVHSCGFAAAAAAATAVL
jgi:hypothetical protein